MSLYPSPSFLAKNLLAKEGPECVDKSLKEDRSLCPGSSVKQTGHEGFMKDISPATISSWIKQTVILCYELSDQEALTLHQVKAHDVRAFAASKAFQGGISLDQFLAACHWKSHNTFTQFLGLGRFGAFSFESSGGCTADPPRNLLGSYSVNSVHNSFYLVA